MDWEVLHSTHGEAVDSMTTCVTDYIHFCVNNTVPVKRVRCFPNNKPCVTPNLNNLLNLKKTKQFKLVLQTKKIF